MTAVFIAIAAIVVILLFLVSASIRIAREYERGVIFRLGRLHSPPKGHCDVSGSGDHLGSEAIAEGIEAKAPAVAVCGHIHESWGCESQVGATPVHNLGPTGTWIEI